ncbi:MAG: transglycosylase SLT domain-containing protein [Myxococcota bacterium]|nr:transglycosylase SLT domain-containing protein [Myxococcota bacterium]
MNEGRYGERPRRPSGSLLFLCFFALCSLTNVESEAAVTDRAVRLLPRSMSFCGEPVMLDQPLVRRRVLAELRRLLKRPAMLKRWQRRARQFFPEISTSIEQAGGCNMLKYLPLLESGLRARAASGAGAKGWWQFIASTAKELSLSRYKNWDERYALERSTKAAITYLRQLYRRFGSWPLALSAYNTGMGRLQRAQAAQQQNQYWMLSLPEEAER